MSGVTGAIVGAAVVGAGATIYASNQASSATRSASNAAITEQEKALQQQATLSQPYRDLGTSNIQTYQNLLTGGAPSQPLSYEAWAAQQGQGPGQPGGATSMPGRPPMSVDGVGRAMLTRGGAGGPAGASGASQAAYQQYLKNFKPTGGGAAGIQQTLESLPGYQFTRDQGIEAAKRANPNLSGNQVVAAEQYGAGLADQTYAERLQQLLQPVQIGQAAAAGQAANIGNAASDISGTLINQGNTQAGIDANTAAGLAKLAGNASGQYMTYQTLQGLNNPGGGVGGQIPNVPSFTPDPSTFTYTGGPPVFGGP